MSELEQKIGRLSLDFTRIEILLSDIAYHIGFTSNSFDFIGRPDTKQKITDLKEFIAKHPQKIKNNTGFNQALIEFDDLREKRNQFIHSIILSSADDPSDFISHKFFLKKESLQRTTVKFKLQDLDDLHKEFVKNHNSIYKAYNSYLN